MGADPPRERRPAVWPWLVMPLVVLAVFCALERMHHRAGTSWSDSWTKHAPGEESPPPAPRQ